MIPRSAVEINAQLPVEATFWTPTPEDLEAEEGFGYFRDVWVIAHMPAEDAQALIWLEAELLAQVDALSNDVEEFDQVAHAIEQCDVESLPERFKTARLDEQIHDAMIGDMQALGGLELGVAGLVYALASVGCFPAASCRSHPDPYTWSHLPVVLVAADRGRGELLARLAAGAQCGLDIDPARPELISVYAASVEDLMHLAQAIVDCRDQFIASGNGTATPGPNVD